MTAPLPPAGTQLDARLVWGAICRACNHAHRYYSRYTVTSDVVVKSTYDAACPECDCVASADHYETGRMPELDDRAAANVEWLRGREGAPPGRVRSFGRGVCEPDLDRIIGAERPEKPEAADDGAVSPMAAAVAWLRGLSDGRMPVGRWGH